MSSERLSRAAISVLHGTGIVLFIGMVLLVLAQVVARKFFEPLVWSEELARYLFIWAAFVGWVIASRNKSHIRISLVVDRAGPRLKLALGVFSDLCVIVLALIFTVIVVVIALSGSLWVMYHLNTNMMPATHDMSQMMG